MGSGHASILCCLAGVFQDVINHLNQVDIGSTAELSFVCGAQMRKPAPVGCLTTERNPDVR